MSGKIQNNTDRQSGVIGSAPSATADANDPTITTNPAGGVGTEWHNTTTGKILICTDATTNLNKWRAQRGTRVHPARGLFMGGQNAASPSIPVNTIDYVTIPTTGNATDFGDMSGLFKHNVATSNGETDRAVSGGGMRDTGTSLNIMEYVTISSPGNTTDFGDLIQQSRQFGATSNGSNDRGVFGGGYTGSGTTNVLQYITISSVSDATDFGNSSSVMQDNSATSNATNERAIWFGGNRPSLSDTIDYITISTTGNATDFGNCSTNVSYPAACSNHTNDRGVRSGGYDGSAQSNVIEYVTISTTGNVTDFGDLIIPVYGARGTESGTGERGLCQVGGYPGGVNHNVIEFITISTPSGATDFGNLTIARGSSVGASSNAG